MLIKQNKQTDSSFYWQQRDGAAGEDSAETEGVKQIHQDGHTTPFPVVVDDHAGQMYGILVVASNPFVSPGNQRKIIILSGISRIATNAIAQLLTDEEYLEPFSRLDRSFVNTDRDIEALVGVKYEIAEGFDNRDTRSIAPGSDAITFEGLVEI